MQSLGLRCLAALIRIMNILTILMIMTIIMIIKIIVMELKIRSTAFSDIDDTYDNDDTLSQAPRRNSCNENDENLQQLCSVQ